MPQQVGNGCLSFKLRVAVIYFTYKGTKDEDIIAEIENKDCLETSSCSRNCDMPAILPSAPPPTRTATDQDRQGGSTLQRLLTSLWSRTRTFWNVLKLIRFSVLLAVVSVAVILFNEQAQDALRALGEEPGLPTVLFVVAAVLCAAVAWWDSRVMFYFRFDNPASDPDVMPKAKEFLPRILGGGALFFTGIAVILASYAYEDWSDPVRWLWGIGIVLIVLALIFVYLTVMRRKWFNGKEPRPTDLCRLRDAPRSHLVPLALTIAVSFALMLLFAYFPVELAPWFGTPAIALLAVAGLIPLGSLLVWVGNRYQLPVVVPLILWAVLNSWLLVDNHLVRVHDRMETHTLSEVPEDLRAKPLPPAMDDLHTYIASWLEDLPREQPAQPVPVLLVAAEGGGIRAAYWTALVLGELDDEARARGPGQDLARHTLAISGVSGGSLGAAAYAALVTQPPTTKDGCTGSTEVRERAERILERDFLSPGIAVMLFPDLFQHFVPYAFINDRAKAIERSWQAAWDDCEAGERFTEPLQNLWTGHHPFETPLLFLNSTVVETGQRMIAAPVPIRPEIFSDALDSRKAIGESVPLATAVHNSARFTYISPAGLIKRQNVPHEQWLHLVDGGYFENSGAVTLAEVLDVLLEVAEERHFEITPVVIHISNDPETSDPEQFDDPYRLAAQIRAPLQALLNTRPARGFQAREDLRRRVLDLNPAHGVPRAYHVHFRLCREVRAPLPLGWTLSHVAKDEMQRQLGAGEVPPNADSIAARNHALRTAVLDILAGERPDPAAIGNGFQCPSEQEQMRLARASDING